MPPAFDSLQTFTAGPGRTGRFYSIQALEKAGLGAVNRLPVSIRIVLESVLRHCDGKRITEQDVSRLAAWQPKTPRTSEIPFVVARIVLQDFTGVPLIVDLAAMRAVLADMRRDPKIVEPLVPVDLVIDHSIQVDHWSSSDALRLNMEMEFRRNHARYKFLKWGMQAFEKLRVVPPGIGIVHQVNLEYLAKGVLEAGGVFYPDTLVGTDSHTTMINGLGIVGWGVGGIEAEAGMLGQPVYFLTPDVIGVNVSGRLAEGVTATDLALHCTQMLRAANVVGKFVEFHGEGAASLPVTDRATIANMSPEYGATMGFFPVDEESCRYLTATGRTAEEVDAFRNYFKAQGLFGMPRAGQCDYTQVLELDLASVRPSVSGPKRPQDRIELEALKSRFGELLQAPPAGGYGKKPEETAARHHVTIGVPGQYAALKGGGKQSSESAPRGISAFETRKHTSIVTEEEMMNNRPTPDRVSMEAGRARVETEIGNGDVVIAAITSCTNTSNPSVMIAAGLVAKKAVERGLKVPPAVKASLAPGSRAVTDYLQKTGLQEPLDRIGFDLVGYGCTTCIGNSGPLDPQLEETVTKNDLVVASVLSGNRNFEARVHQNVKANFLMSPPLVVAFALAGRIGIDLTKEPIGKGSDGRDVYLRDLWPTPKEIADRMALAFDPAVYRRLYSDVETGNPLWNEIESGGGQVYEWDPHSTYIRKPPFFEGFTMDPPEVATISGARLLAAFGDSVTTDHISPAGSIKTASSAGKYLQELGVEPADFNSYGARRGNHEVMMRGTFANVRIRNLLVPGVEGAVAVHQPSGERMSLFDAAMRYWNDGVPLVVMAGAEYGTGSSRDWAAKGPALLGVRAVVAKSFERIHRSNLVGMGILPCQFPEGTGVETLHLDGTETFDITGIEKDMRPGQQITLVIHRKDGRTEQVPLKLRIDVPVELDYYRHGGILPYVLRQLMGQKS